MLNVWWGINGIIHWEILSSGCTMTTDLHCRQLNRVAEKLKEEKDRIYSLHDKVRPHVATSTYEKLLKLGWPTVSHPPYSPDLAPMNYHLLRLLSNHLRAKKFDDENDLKIDLINFFSQNFKDFYGRWILSLPER